MNVYFARAMARAAHSVSQEGVHDTVVKAIKDCGCRPQFELVHGESMSKHLRSEDYIYQRDMNWLLQCNAMIAEVSNPSHGVGYDLAIAKHVLKIPVLCVALKDTTVSAMITGDLHNPSDIEPILDMYYYRDLIDLECRINDFLKFLKEGE